MSDTVTISKDEYEELLDLQRFYRRLEAWGIDNWDGYGYARAEHMEEDDE